MGEADALSPGEAFVLLRPETAGGPEALKPELLLLLLRGRIRIEEQAARGRFGRQVVQQRLYTTSPFAKLPGPTGAVLRCLSGFGAAGATMPEVVRALRESFGQTLIRFVSEHVRPSLVTRGLLESYRAKHLGLFPYQRHRPTAQGHAEQERLGALVARAKQYAGHRAGGRADDPAEIAALVAGLGASILIVRELQPHLGGLFRLLREASVGGTVLTGHDGFHPFDHDAFDLGGFDDAMFEGIDASLSALDAGFDASSGGDSGSSGDSGGSSGD